MTHTPATPQVTPAIAHAIAQRMERPDYPRWAARTRALGGCCQPIHLRGRVQHIDALTGKTLHTYSTTNEPDGVLRVPCKTRRATRCEPCAETYRADTYQLVKAGLVGGKGVPQTVTAHPAAFLTLTAPSFGQVHSRRSGKSGQTLACHPRRNAAPCPNGRVHSCTTRHAPDDPALGEPLCPDCYDYTGSVLFNSRAPELWRRFGMALRRYLAKAAGLTLTQLRETLTVSFAKVAEFQRRGVVHFHAVIRLDGPGGPSSPPPSWATFTLLTSATQHAATAVQVTCPAASGLPARSFTWGAQLDIRPINSNGTLTDGAVAGYIAKYATKAAECTGTLDRRIHTTDNLHDLPIRQHARRLIAECLRLGSLEELAELRLAEWAHMLGFRGHFSTKSRRYSTTLSALRQARIDYRTTQHQISTGRLPFEDDTVLVVGTWTYLGQGITPGDAVLAAALTGRPLPPLCLPDTLQGYAA